MEPPATTTADAATVWATRADLTSCPFWGGSELVATLDWHGPLAPLVRLVIGRLAERYVETELARLVARCERG